MQLRTTLCSLSSYEIFTASLLLMKFKKTSLKRKKTSLKRLKDPQIRIRIRNMDEDIKEIIKKKASTIEN